MWNRCRCSYICRASQLLIMCSTTPLQLLCVCSQFYCAVLLCLIVLTFFLRQFSSSRLALH
ncbi:hypothetical protein V3C99_008313 [Haemonchus contortus]